MFPRVMYWYLYVIAIYPFPVYHVADRWWEGAPQNVPGP